jgi:hypothetical protein
MIRRRDSMAMAGASIEFSAHSLIDRSLMIEEYRRNYEECRRNAETALTLEMKAKWQKIAQEWVRLANAAGAHNLQPN